MCGNKDGFHVCEDQPWESCLKMSKIILPKPFHFKFSVVFVYLIIIELLALINVCHLVDVNCYVYCLEG